MSEINDPQAVKFCNERLRVAADAAIQAYRTLKQLKAEWEANNLGALIPPTDDLIADGSQIDGRPRLSGSLATIACGAIAQRIIDSFESLNGDALAILLKIAVNTAPRF